MRASSNTNIAGLVGAAPPAVPRAGGVFTDATDCPDEHALPG